jgi:hypothetical protein
LSPTLVNKDCGLALSLKVKSEYSWSLCSVPNVPSVMPFIATGVGLGGPPESNSQLVIIKERMKIIRQFFMECSVGYKKIQFVECKESLPSYTIATF